MAHYHTLAKAEEVTPFSSGYPWPYEVSICFGGVRHPVIVAEGVAHGAAATPLTAAEALEDRWRDHFVKSQGEWLLPIIRRMAAGEDVAADKVLTAYKNLHGREAPAAESGIRSTGT